MRVKYPALKYIVDRKINFSFLVLSAMVILFILSISLAQNPVVIPSQADIEQIGLTMAGKYKAVLTSPPNRQFHSVTPDGALLGNGDVGVVIGGDPDELIYLFGKNEYWTDSLFYKSNNISEPAWGGGQLPMATMRIRMNALSDASYRLEELFNTGEVTGEFTRGSTTLSMRSWIASDENLFVIEYTASGGAISAQASLAVVWEGGSGDRRLYQRSGREEDVIWLYQSADAKVSLPSPEVKTATRVIGTQGTANSNNTLSFTIPSGGTVYVVTAILSDKDNPQNETVAVERVKNMTTQELTQVKNKHQQFWEWYHGKSFVRIPDEEIEKYYYSSVYLMGCVSREGEYPPGLVGPWGGRHQFICRGDFTLNYNYQAGFFGCFATNHLEAVANYHVPLIDWLPNAKERASWYRGGYPGAFYQVHIGPLPSGSIDTNTWSNLYCGSLGAHDMLMYYYSSYDNDYAQTIYPYLTALADFWEAYLKFENNRYVAYNDDLNERVDSDMRNNTKTMSSLKMMFLGLLDISEELGVDAGRREKWRHIYDYLIYPSTSVSGGGYRFRTAENSNGSNSFPFVMDYFGLESDPDSQAIALNTVSSTNWWNSNNWSMYQYWAAARVGYDPENLMDRMKNSFFANRGGFDNLHLSTGGGGIENLNVVPPAVTEMLLQSHQHVIHVFPNWPMDMDASYGNLRAYGAFLVSSDLVNGTVRYVRIVSEKGRPAVVGNPWEGRSVDLYRNGVKDQTLSGEKMSFTTSSNELIVLVPEGTPVEIPTSVKYVAPFRFTPRIIRGKEEMRISSFPKGQYQVSLLTLGGRTVSSQIIRGTSCRINLKNVRSGMYLATIRALGGTDKSLPVWSGKVVVY